MEKKFSKYTRKALSVFMAFMMVFTMFVFTPGMFKKAEAANAGNYYVEIDWQCENDKNFSNNFTGTETESGARGGMTLYYKTNNGFGTEQSVYWDFGKSGNIGGTYVTDVDRTSTNMSKTGNFTEKVIVNGWPTGIYAMLDSDNVFDRAQVKIKALRAGSSASDMKTLWTGEMELNTLTSWFGEKIYMSSSTSSVSSWAKKNGSNGGDSDNYVKTTTDSWKTNWPKQNSVSWTNTALTATVPKDGNVTVTTQSATVKDQYGVEWYQEPYYAVSDSATATSTSKTLSGISITSGMADKCTATITNAAKSFINPTPDTSTYKKDFYITAYSGEKLSTTTKVTLTNVKYKFTLDGNGGTLATGTGDQEKYYGYTYGTDPSATRTGYEFKGFYDVKSTNPYGSTFSGSQLSSGTQITSDKTWYAAWQANMYTATFLRKTSNTETEVFATKDVYMAQVPTAPAGTPADYDEGDYHYTFSGWPTFSAMTQNGATYTANYSSAFVAADYTALENAIADAQAIIAEADYEAQYSEITRKALTRALDAAVAFDAATPHIGRTQQALVDSKMSAVLNAIDDLEPAQYSVLYINNVDDSVIKTVFPVSNNSAIAYPADPTAISNGASGHYKFREWVPASDGYDMSAVKTNMVIYADFELVEHNFTTETIPSNCTAEGRTVYTCSDCGYSYEETNGTMGDHTWEAEWTEDVPATCIAAGSKSKHCSVCGAKSSITELPALTHDYIGATEETVLAAGCTSHGVTAKLCNRCGYKLTTVTDPTEHEYEEVVTQPTCTTLGYTTKTCSACGDVVTTDYTAPKAHTYVEDTSKAVAATCTTNGLKFSYCSCGAEKVDVINPTGHTWETEKTVDLAAACGAAGQKSTHCSVCGAIDADSIETIDALEHNFNTTGTVVVEASCGVNSVTKYPCENGCGEYNVVTGSDALTHSFTSTGKTEATCTADGSETFKCDNCDEEKTTVLPKTGHNYVAQTAVPASCTAPEYTPYVCANAGCGDTYNAYTAGSEALGHTLSYVIGNGYITVECDNCDYEKTFDEALPVDGGHTWEKISEKDATCSEDGEIVFGCVDTGCTVDNVTVTVPKNTDAHELTTTVVPATCTVAGKAVTTCANCSYKEEKVIDATGHTFGFPGTVTKAATCTEDGVITFKCANCTATSTQAVPATGHVYEETADKAEATCVAPAYTVYKCATCDETINVTTGNADKTKHNFEVTSTVVGNTTEIKIECTICGAVKEEVVNAPHNYTRAVITAMPKCNAQGTVRIYCGDTDCAYYEDVAIDTIGHTYAASYTAPTCTTTGSVRYFCTACGAEDTTKAVTIPTIAHNYVKTETATATCSKAGYDKYVCNDCDDVIYRNVVSATNNHVYKAIAELSATCTLKSGTRYECLTCAHTYDVRDGKLAPHTWTATMVVDTPATCSTQGSKSYHCTVCGAKGTSVVVSKTAHDFDYTGADLPSGVEDGYAWRTIKCKNCDYKVAQFTFFGTPDAMVTITDSHGEVVFRGTIDPSGELSTEDHLFRVGKYTVKIKADINHSVEGVLSVSINGTVSGKLDNVANVTCGHLCHTGWFGRFIRRIYTFISYRLNITAKCCDDMEWYGPYAEYLK